MPNNEITLKIQSSNAVDFIAKIEALRTIALLDTDTLVFLGELSKSEKAISKLNKNKTLIKNMVM
jgi:hypothetical protein